MAVPFWIMNLSPQRLQALEARWSDPLTQAQLANPWQTVLIDGTRVPGVVTMERIKRKLRAQKNTKGGGDGGSATIRGLENPEFSMRVEIYVPSQFSALLQLIPQLDVIGKGKRTDRKNITHPMAQMLGVRSVSFMSIEVDSPMAGGPMVVLLGMLGYGQQSTGTTTTTKATPPPTPTVALPDGGSPRDRLPNYVVRPPGGGR